MNISRPTFLLCLILCSHATGVPMAARQSVTIESLIDAAVESAKAGDSDAAEFRASRRQYAFDVDADGDEDVISVFVIEGFNQGNNQSAFMALHIRQENRLATRHVVRIGRSLARHVDVDRVRLVDGVLRVGMHTFNRADANCCPSRESEAVYEVNDERMEEITPIAVCADPLRCWWTR